MRLAAVIFDLDGTVLDNEDEYGASFKKVLERLGAKGVPDYPQTGGIGVEENWPGLLAKYHIKTQKSLEELAAETQAEYLKLLPGVTVKTGFENFARHLGESGIKTALATSNVWYILEKVFESLPIEKLFDSITTGEEVTQKKPAPDLFLAAAEKLNFPAAECLVIEDAASGIEAAHRAGMKVVGLARSPEHAKTLEDADLVVGDYNQLSPEEVLAL